jgi:UDP-GlcNAc3NAcA epimerase
MNILTVVGARPQFIKAAVFSRYIRNNPSLGITETLVHTGQHYDENMSGVFFKEMEIPEPDVNLHTGSGTHGKMTGEMLIMLEAEMTVRKPDAVLVYGDTNSTLAGALAASKLHIPVAHVEAGLRSFMMAMPEEQNRVLSDHISTWLFCPTETAVRNLRNDGIADYGRGAAPDIDRKRVALTGDIMYEAALYYQHKSVAPAYSDFILFTLHRAENTDNPARLKSITDAVNALDGCRFVFPMHPRTKKILAERGLRFGSHVTVTEPVGYLEMIGLEAACSAVLTDSGGVQKEAFFFKKPCVTLRDSTEWVELVDAGWNSLTGVDSEKIISAVKNIRPPAAHPALYGDGRCAEKIAAELQGV